MLHWADEFDLSWTAASQMDDDTGSYNNSGFCIYNATGGINGGGSISGDSASTTRRLRKDFSGFTHGVGNPVRLCQLRRMTESLNSYIIEIGTNVNGVGDASAGANSPKVRWDTDGSLHVLNHGGDVTLGSSAAGLMSLNTWYCLEYIAEYHNSGYIVLKLNGVEIINTGTVDTTSGTAPTSITSVNQWVGGGAATSHVDDILYWNDDDNGDGWIGSYADLHEAATGVTGSGVGRFPVMSGHQPDSNGDTNNFTPSAGSNYQNVDDAGFRDGNTTYNDGAAAGDKDLYNVTNQASTPDALVGVCCITYSYMSVAGTVTSRGLIKHGSTEFESADRIETTNITRYCFGTTINPDTGNPWGATDFNGVQVGIKYQA